MHFYLNLKIHPLDACYIWPGSSCARARSSSGASPADRVYPPFPFPPLPFLLCEIEHPNPLTCAKSNTNVLYWVRPAPMLSTRTAYAPGPPNGDAVLGWGHGGRKLRLAMFSKQCVAWKLRLACGSLLNPFGDLVCLKLLLRLVL